MKFQSARQQVVEMSVLLADHGYFAATGGNLALKVDDEHIVVTPSAMDYYEMTAADACVLRLRDLAKIDGDRKPTVEAGMHAKLLSIRTDCRASIHTHQPIASACTLLGKPVPVLRAEDRALLGDEVRVVGYAPSGTSWLSSKLAKAVLPDANAYLLRTHGAICCGTSAERALRAISALERLTLDYLRERITARAAQASPQQAALQRLLATLDAQPIQEMVV
ncbi:class II aldolase/adducin family protein [Dyella acidisoli]|uniref:L-ribulose-5-phosphate 4-epimerase n=1 Tax=Dyella acidisoli TaxID=1867834 RepID=A0ABQ5XJ86_9GAMM|nr:class II aldolase/adducin family protein [Dyella acidisoli]GLQ91133.1 L-ribulose-5-phosphate 4-epimerase [Dyella acidisoli]